MQNNQVEYRNAIHALGDGEAAPLGFDVVTLNRKGKHVSGIAAVLPVLRHRIAVHSNFYRTITNAAARVKHFLEPQIFQTREKTEFNLHLRVSVDRSRCIEIAQNHFHEVLVPEDLFFREFARLLLGLLESSARRETGSIDDRIGANRREWQKELESKLSDRFSIGVEIQFDIEREVAPDKNVRTEPGEYRHVNFRDRIDKTYPLMIDLRLRKESSTQESSALPREETKLKTNLFDMVARTCEEDLTLHDYWFDPGRMHRVVGQRLNAYLQSYAHSVANLQITRPSGEANAPPNESDKLSKTVSWRDIRGYDLQFRAEAIAVISKDGAGLYDRQGRPDRGSWFAHTISRELELRLAGVSIVDLDDAVVERHNKEVEKAIARRAEEIGLNLDLFIGQTYLPNLKWKKPVIVSVPNQPYLTADPIIAGYFSMDIELSFENRKATEAFMNAFHRSKLYDEKNNNDSSDNLRALPDEFIEKTIVELAEEAATFEMKHIDPNDYFTDFVARENWGTAIPTLSLLGAKSGANVIQDRIRRTLKERFAGVSLHSIRFHRADNNLEDLRDLISKLPRIDFESLIVNHEQANAALDCKLMGYFSVVSGDAARIVWMLHKGLAKATPKDFASEIREHLKDVVANRLHNAKLWELNSLIESLTGAGANYEGALRTRLKKEIEKTVKENFGLICGDIELKVQMSPEYEELRRLKAEVLSTPLTMNQTERDALERDFASLLAERSIVVGVSDEDIRKRNLLTVMIEDVKRQMDSLQNNASGRSRVQLSEDIANGAFLFSDRRDERGVGGRDRIVEPSRKAPHDDTANPNAEIDDDDDEL